MHSYELILSSYLFSFFLYGTFFLLRCLAKIPKTNENLLLFYFVSIWILLLLLLKLLLLLLLTIIIIFAIELNNMTNCYQFCLLPNRKWLRERKHNWKNKNVYSNRFFPSTSHYFLWSNRNLFSVRNIILSFSSPFHRKNRNNCNKWLYSHHFLYDTETQTAKRIVSIYPPVPSFCGCLRRI